VWDGTLSYTLPPVVVDDGPDDCAPGWNACAEGHTALRIAGLWPDGRPSRLFRVETDGLVVERGDKLRAATWCIVEEILDVTPHVRRMSEPFGELADEITAEQMAWRAALARPRHDEAAIETGLREALAARGIESWTLRRFNDAWAARDARAAWAARDARDARAAWAAWTAWAAWAARAAWDAWDARAAWDAWDAWAARDARDARAARDAWDAWDARDALLVFYTSRRGWISSRTDLLTTGIRDAYAAGLAVAIPTGPTELGWAMEAT